MDFEIRETVFETEFISSDSVFETEFDDSNSSFETDINSEVVYYPKPAWVDELRQEVSESVIKTTEEADRSESEADRAESEADRAEELKNETEEKAEQVDVYVNEMLDGSRLVEVSEAPTEGKLWVDITPEEEEEVYTVEEVDNKFTTKRLLTYDGSTIRLDGMIQTYSDLYDACMNRPDFVVLVYNDRAYHVNRVSNEQIVFITSYVSGGYVKMDRISISDDDVVTLTTGEAEMVVNKVGSITDANKTSTTKYPSVKAVNDLVEEIKHSGIAYDDTEVRADIAELQSYFTDGKANRVVVVTEEDISGPIDATTLNGKSEGDLSVAHAVDSDTLAGNNASYFATHSALLGTYRSHILMSDGVSGSAGYVCIAKITVSGTYSNDGMAWLFTQRARLPCFLMMNFNNQNGTTPSIQSFQYIGGPPPSVVAITNGSVTEIYVQKTENYDCITLFKQFITARLTGITVENPGSFVSELPSGTKVSATKYT